MNFKCIFIDTDNTITDIIMAFSINNKSPQNNKDRLIYIFDYIYICRYYALDIVRIDNFSYSIFYESNISRNDLAYNTLGSKLISKQCYGACYLVKHDIYYNLTHTDSDSYIYCMNYVMLENIKLHNHKKSIFEKIKSHIKI
jgi:hypothetical protein